MTMAAMRMQQATALLGSTRLRQGSIALLVKVALVHTACMGGMGGTNAWTELGGPDAVRIFLRGFSSGCHAHLHVRVAVCGPRRLGALGGALAVGDVARVRPELLEAAAATGAAEAAAFPDRDCARSARRLQDSPETRSQAGPRGHGQPVLFAALQHRCPTFRACGEHASVQVPQEQAT